MSDNRPGDQLVHRQSSFREAYAVSIDQLIRLVLGQQAGKHG